MNEVKIYKPVLCFKQGLQLTKIYSPKELGKIEKGKVEKTFFHPSITYRQLREIPRESEADTSWFPGGLSGELDGKLRWTKKHKSIFGINEKQE